MQSLRLAGVLFLVIAVLAIVAGGASLYMGSEAADNECDDDNFDPCAGRDARSAGFLETGRFLMWGGFLGMALAATLFVLAARRPAAAPT